MVFIGTGCTSVAAERSVWVFFLEYLNGCFIYKRFAQAYLFKWLLVLLKYVNKTAFFPILFSKFTRKPIMAFDIVFSFWKHKMKPIF